MWPKRKTANDRILFSPGTSIEADAESPNTTVLNIGRVWGEGAMPPHQLKSESGAVSSVRTRKLRYSLTQD